MTKSISEILSREPDGRQDGNVYFHTPFDEDIRRILAAGVPGLPWSSVEEYHSWKAGMIRERFMDCFLQRGSGVDCLWATVPELRKIFAEIAAGGELVLDIASDFGMGMIPYLLHLYPDIPVCVSDLDEGTMRTLAECLREELPAYRIAAASFDNNDIPIRDNTVPYVTGIDAIRSSAPNGKGDIRFAYCRGREKAIAEVYRILRPGGYFIASEQWADCDIDLQLLYETCLAGGGLFGVFPFEQLLNAVSLILRDSWREAFAAAGFEIAAEREFMHRLTGSGRMRFLKRYIQTEQTDIHAEPENIGLDIYEGEVLYILRKPAAAGK